jgi:hypothetical protein
VDLPDFVPAVPVDLPDFVPVPADLADLADLAEPVPAVPVDLPDFVPVPADLADLAEPVPAVPVVAVVREAEGRVVVEVAVDQVVEAAIGATAVIPNGSIAAQRA